LAAVLLACAAGVLYGAVAVTLRLGLARNGDAYAGALASIVVAFAVCAVAAAVAAKAPGGLGDVWPYLLGGALAPGISQLLFVLAVREIGSSRTGVVAGAAPLLSGLLAIVFLDEPVRVALVVGTVLIVLGGGLLAGERGRPAHFRAIGILLALVSAFAFGVRDNVVRWAAGDTAMPPLFGAATVLGAGGVVLAAYLLVARGPALGGDLRRALRPFLLSGLLFGAAYACILEAFERGKVTVVSPLVGTESLWAVALAAFVLGRSEMIGRRVAAAGALVVAGGALIGSWR
jgi:drug/metabolite transporter (DMT)-like permease